MHTDWRNEIVCDVLLEQDTFKLLEKCRRPQQNISLQVNAHIYPSHVCALVECMRACVYFYVLTGICSFVCYAFLLVLLRIVIAFNL